MMLIVCGPAISGKGAFEVMTLRHAGRQPIAARPPASGELEFVVVESQVVRQDGALVMRIIDTLIVKQ